MAQAFLPVHYVAADTRSEQPERRVPQRLQRTSAGRQLSYLAIVVLTLRSVSSALFQKPDPPLAKMPNRKQ